MKKLFTLVFLCLFALSTFAQELGSFNAEFGTDGSFVFDPSSAHDFMEKILVQEDGKIITIGRARVDGSNYSVYVSRHNADGSLDETYGEGGIVYLKVVEDIYFNNAFDADFDENGNLYIAGCTFDMINNTAFVICLDENGSEKEDYGENGYAVTEYGGGVVYEAIDVDAQGRAVVAGYINDQILVRRYNAKGELDTTFGDEGSVIIKLDSSPYARSYAYDIKVLDNGKVVVAGCMTEDAGEGYYIFKSCVLRLKSNGDLDNTFGDGGTLLLYAGEYAKCATSISVQPDGKYIIAGNDELLLNTPEMPRCESYVTRVNTNGTVDKTFGDNGFVKFEPFEGDGCVNYCYTVETAPDGQIFGAIYSYNYSNKASRAYVFNLKVDGQLNEDFAGSGIVALPKYADDECEIEAQTVALKDNKNLLVGGYIYVDEADNSKLFISDINVDVNTLVAPVVTAETSGVSSVILRWESVEGAKAYVIYQEQELLDIITDTIVEMSGLEANTEYCFRVKAIDGNYESAMSNEACAKTLEIPIMSPIGVVATEMNASSIVLLWNSVENASSYNVYRNDVLIVNVTNTNYIDEGLQTGMEYCYNVTALRISDNDESEKSLSACVTISDDDTDEPEEPENPGGNEPADPENPGGDEPEEPENPGGDEPNDPENPGGDEPDEPEEPVAPATPKNVVAEALNSTTILLEWEAVKDADSYNVYQNGDLVDNVESVVYKAEDLEADTEYCFTVVAVSKTGKSAESDEACATTKPDAISELTSSFRLYPNPVNDKLYIETQTLTQTLTVEIYDVYGRQQSTVNGQQPMVIDVTNLNSGVYFVMIKTNEGVVTKRFVKQ